jgi:glucuronoarabinoxylan endo-1,4-beta-xylanase
MPVGYGSCLQSDSPALTAVAKIGTTKLDGTFSYSPATGTCVSTLGDTTLKATFTPKDATNYNTATASTTLTVVKSTPAIKWATPAPVVQGTALSSSQLNASFMWGSVPGTFSYTPDLGTVMNTPGTSTLFVTFTPTDGTKYNTATTSTALTVVPVAGTAIVDFASAQQTIKGFGASEAWYGASVAQIAKGYGTGSGDLGLTIMRLRIAPTTWDSSTQTAGTSAWDFELARGKAAQDLGATIFASPWTPPPSMKINNASRDNGTWSGSLNPASYSDYAKYLSAYINYAASKGVNLYAISMQNEPDWDPKDYESCLWTGDQMATWAANNGAEAIGGTNVKLMMPESFYFSPDMYAPALNNPDAANNIGIIGGHFYGRGPYYPRLAKDLGKEVWETEHAIDPIGSSNSASSWSLTIADGINAAKEIHDTMTLGQFNAYNWWWLLNSNDNQPTGLIDHNNNSTYFGIALEHFSKFVRPGYVHYEATSQPVSGVYLSAYAGNGHQVLVVINSTNSPVILPIRINNQSVTSLTPYQTTSTASVVQLSPIAVAGNTFTATLPAQSITTYVQ